MRRLTVGRRFESYSREPALIMRDEATSSADVERTVLIEDTGDRISVDHVHCHRNERVAPVMPTIRPGGRNALIRVVVDVTSYDRRWDLRRLKIANGSIRG
jgi:hypothetical protein